MKREEPQPLAEPSAKSRRARRIGRLQSRLLLYLAILAGLGVVNAVAHPGTWWVLWVALGLGIASLAQVWRVVVTPRFLR